MVPFMPEEIRRVIDAKRRAAAGDDDGDMDDEAPEPEDVEIRPDSSTDIFSFAVLIIALTASAVGEEVGSLDKKGNLKLRAEVNRLRRSSPQRRLAYRGVQNDALFMQLICNMLSDTKAVRPSIEEVQGHLPQAIIMPISE
ncbi:hypothetical protein DL93DRAFT_2073260 [Clavulina sp. PMI_390]|nr:hypothetical protein DL93DRAFT_2073260 [Clavulina sp. PMI_390]